MRVLQVHTRYRQAGGEDAVVDAEARLLRAAGHEVDQWVVQNPSRAGASAGALARSAWNTGARREAERRARALRPDVAHVHNTWYALSPSVLAGLAAAGVPVVATLHNYRLTCVNGLLFRDGVPCTDCVGRSPWPGVRHGCYRGSVLQSAVAGGGIALQRVLGTWATHVQVFLALTEFARAQFVTAGLPADAILVRPNAVADPGPRPAAPSASRTVLFVGRLTPEKGADTLVEAWGRLAPRTLELVVVGDGPLRGDLERALPAGVSLLGWQPPARVAALLQSGRALAFPSRWYEGQPMTILEAFAAGLPVLGSDLGGTAETILPLGAGWRVPPDDPAAWDAALAHLTDDAAVDSAGREARRAYEARHTPAAALASLEQAYRLAAERGARPTSGAGRSRS